MTRSGVIGLTLCPHAALRCSAKRIEHERARFLSFASFDTQYDILYTVRLLLLIDTVIATVIGTYPAVTL